MKFKMVVPNLSKIHLEVDGASRPSHRLKFLIVPEHLDCLLHGSVYDVNQGDRVVSEELVELVLFAIPYFDVKPLLLELKIGCVVNRLNGPF